MIPRNYLELLEIVSLVCVKVGPEAIAGKYFTCRLAIGRRMICFCHNVYLDGVRDGEFMQVTSKV